MSFSCCACKPTGSSQRYSPVRSHHSAGCCGVIYEAWGNVSRWCMSLWGVVSPQVESLLLRQQRNICLVSNWSAELKQEAHRSWYLMFNERRLMFNTTSSRHWFDAIKWKYIWLSYVSYFWSVHWSRTEIGRLKRTEPVPDTEHVTLWLRESWLWVVDGDGEGTDQSQHTVTPNYMLFLKFNALIWDFVVCSAVHTHTHTHTHTQFSHS